jgi:hypothetical protein
MIYIHPHAVTRFQERVAPVSYDDARAEILSHAKAIECAASFGCQIIKLGNGARLIIDGENVITVYARKVLPRQCRRGLPA